MHPIIERLPYIRGKLEAKRHRKNPRVVYTAPGFGTASLIQEVSIRENRPPGSPDNPYFITTFVVADMPPEVAFKVTVPGAAPALIFKTVPSIETLS